MAPEILKDEEYDLTADIYRFEKKNYLFLFKYIKHWSNDVCNVIWI